MRKNPLFYAKSNANKMKIAFAKRKLYLSITLIAAIFAMVFISMPEHTSAKAIKVQTGAVSFAALPLVLFKAGVKDDSETEEEFKAREGKAETNEAFIARCIKWLNHEVGELKKAGGDKDHIKTIKTLTERLEKLEKSEDIETLKQVKEELGKANLAIEALQEKKNPGGTSIQAQVSKFIKDNAEKIKELYQKGSGYIEFKAVGEMTTGSATNPDGIPELQGVQAAPPTNVNLRASIVDGLVTLFPTSLSSYPYTESVPKDGDYSFVAEGGTKPQIDFEIQTRYAAPKKVAAHIILTEESVTDIPGLQGISVNYLRAKHDLKRQTGILFGDGIGQNPKGVKSYGRAFVVGAMANKVKDPNFMDVVNACIADIFTTHNYQDEMPYLANMVLVHPIDFFTELVSAKDGFGHPLYPTANLFQRVTIGGVTIIPYEHPDLPAGSIIVADMSKYNITNYVGYTVRIGWINDQFITNMFTMVGESRFHAFVKKLDEQAFIYDQIETIKAAIKAV